MRENRFVGCAGWGIPPAHADCFPGEGTHLERYGRVFNAVEINSSFYRPHRPDTYRRWADSVPEAFRFAVKVPKAITHTRRLKDAEAELDRFLGEAGCLESRLGPLLVQLPPRLKFDAATAGGFFTVFRDRFAGEIACEPRHATWFTPEGEGLLDAFRVARVAADPPRGPGGDAPGGWSGLRYYRLHGSPKVYYSEYSPEVIQRLVDTVRATPDDTPVWCIFDNTAEGAATANALDLRDRLASPEEPPGAPAASDHSDLRQSSTGNSPLNRPSDNSS